METENSTLKNWQTPEVIELGVDHTAIKSASPIETFIGGPAS